MTVKEYFEQAYRIDQRINSKLELVSSLRALATKATSTLSGMPPSGTPNVHRMEDIIVKIIDMENDINADIDKLVDLKNDIIKKIHSLEDVDQQTVLELRYLCYRSWNEISNELGYSVKQVRRIRDRAFENIYKSCPIMSLKVTQCPLENSN